MLAYLCTVTAQRIFMGFFNVFYGVSFMYFLSFLRRTEMHLKLKIA